MTSLARKIARSVLPSPIKALPWRVSWMRSRARYPDHPATMTWRLARFTWKELVSSELEVVAPDGTRYVSMPANTSSLAVFVEGGTDPENLAFIERHLRPGGTFVDVGSNIGFYSVPAGRLVGPEGRVVAIEAHPRTFEFLRRNLARNDLPHVTAVHSAVGEAPGSVSMVYCDANAGGTHVGVNAEEAGVNVPVRTLDAILEDAGVASVDYLKIDVEGYELPVLRGAQGIIAGSAGIVVQVEHWETDVNPFGFPLAAAAELLVGLGLAPYRPDGAGSVRRVPMDLLSATFGDVLWMRPDTAAAKILPGC